MVVLFGSPCLPQAGTVGLPYGYSIFVIPASHLSFPHPICHSRAPSVIPAPDKGIRGQAPAGNQKHMNLDSRFHACVPKRLYFGVQARE